MREAWTDERLDDLNAKVDDGFRRQEVQVGEVRSEIRDVRGEVRELRTEMNGRLDQMYRILVIASISLVVGFLGVIASILATGA